LRAVRKKHSENKHYTGPADRVNVRPEKKFGQSKGENKMVRATKATLKRLEDWRNWTATPYVRQSTLLENTIRAAESSERNGDPVTRAHYTDDCLYVLAEASEKPLFRGLSTRWPKLIEVTFTHGLNEVCILDVNKLVKAMMTVEA
jgi:hypothetical protein